MHATTSTRPSSIRRIALATTLLLALAGCAGEDPASAPATSEPAATAAPATDSPAPDATDVEPTATEATDDGATDGATVVAVADSDLGPILVDSAGITLYAFDNDDVDTSACTGDCLGAWPVLEASTMEAGDGVEGEVATFTRDDGTEQATINGLPLYYFASDEAPGDHAGQGVGGVWWVVDANGVAVTGTADATESTEASYGEPAY